MRVSEKTEQAHGVQLLRSLQAAVYVLGTVRKRGDYPGTRQTPGLPDVLAFLPWQPSRRARELLCWEVKAIGGRVRTEQRLFQALCGEAEIWHVTGTFDVLIGALASHGYVNRSAFAHRLGEVTV